MKKRFVILAIALAVGILCFFYDLQIAEFFKAIQNPAILSAFSFFNKIGIFLLLAVILIILIKERKSPLNKKIGVLFASLATIISVFIIKLAFSRARPFEFVKIMPIINIIDYSFPSMHSALVFSVLPFLEKESKLIRYSWIAFACLMGFSRIYSGVHYLSDVIFGAVIGYVIGYLIKRKFAER